MTRRLFGINCAAIFVAGTCTASGAFKSMKKIPAILTYIIAVGVNMCLAQSNNSQKINQWGESIQGVQLSISMTNSIFRVGSSTTVMSITKNSSTNNISVETSFPTISFDVLLANDTGKLYHVTTKLLRIRGMAQYALIKPGEESVESIPVTFGQDIESGGYTLKASREFTSSEGHFTLESNSLKVRIIQ